MNATICQILSSLHAWSDAGPSRESCHELAKAFSRRTGLEDYAVLFSEREFKKVRLRYFLPELDRWWRDRTGG